MAVVFACHAFFMFRSRNQSVVAVNKHSKSRKLQACFYYVLLGLIQSLHGHTLCTVSIIRCTEFRIAIDKVIISTSCSSLRLRNIWEPVNISDLIKRSHIQRDCSCSLLLMQLYDKFVSLSKYGQQRCSLHLYFQCFTAERSVTLDTLRHLMSFHDLVVDQIRSPKNVTWAGIRIPIRQITSSFTLISATCFVINLSYVSVSPSTVSIKHVFWFVLSTSNTLRTWRLSRSGERFDL